MPGKKGIDIPVEISGAQKGVQDLDQLNAAEQRVANTVNDSGNKADSASGKVGKLTRQKGLLAGAASRVSASVGSMVTSLLSVGAAIAIFNKLAEALERIQRAQDKIAGKGIGTLEATQPLATQLQKFDEKGQLETSQLAIDIQRAGRFSSLPGAVNFAIAADVAFASSGGLSNPKNVEITKSLGSVLGPQIGDDTAAGKAALELLKRSGRLGSKDDALLALDQLQSGSIASDFNKFGDFLNAALKGGAPLLAEGGNLVDVIEQLVRARTVTTDEQAGTALEQLVRVSRGEGQTTTANLLRKKAAKRGKELGKLSFAERLDLLGEVFDQSQSDPKLREELAASFPSEIFGKIKSAFTTKTQETVDVALEKVGEASSQRATQVASEFVGSPLGKQRESEAEARQKDLDVAREKFSIARRRREAREQRERQEAEGKSPAFKSDTVVERDILFTSLLQELGLAGPEFDLEKTPELVAKKLGRKLTKAETDAIRRAVFASQTEGVVSIPFVDVQADTEAVQDLEKLIGERHPVIVNNNQNNGTVNHYNGRDPAGRRDLSQRGGRR